MSVSVENGLERSTYRTTRFRHVSVSRALIAEIADMVQRGESTVLLGSRGIGKQVLSESVFQEVVRRDPACRALTIDLARFVHSQQQRFELFVSRVLQKHLLGAQRQGVRSLAELAEAFRADLREHPTSVVAFISNVDVLPDSDARRLLNSLRDLTQLGSTVQGRLTVVLTGSADLAPLVYGVNSEFAVREQFVVHGFDREMFGEMTRHAAKRASLTCDSDAVDAIFEQTGGSPLMMRILVDTLAEQMRVARKSEAKAVAVGGVEVRRAARCVASGTVLFRDVVTHLFSRLESSMNGMDDLPALLESESRPASRELDAEEPFSTSVAPSELELSGIARRRTKRLEWASPLIEAAARRYFAGWTLGDALACGHRWDAALQAYRQADKSDRPYVASTVHRPRLTAALRAFESRLFTLAISLEKPTDEIREFFLKGARYLLGFDEIGFWTERGRDWVRQGEETAAARPPEVTRQRHLLAAAKDAENGLVALTRTEDAIAMAWRMRASLGEPAECVVLSNYATESPLTKARRVHTERVLEIFDRAFEHARRARRDAREVRQQRSLLEAIPDILGAIGNTADRTRLALRKAGEQLRESGYFRVMFSLVDQGTNQIVGVEDCRPPNEPDIAQMTRWTLSMGYEMYTIYQDVQQRCVDLGEPVIVDDAARDAWTNQAVVRAAGLQAFAILPLGRGREVLGTMHVERADRRPLTKEELKSLQFFADQLTRAVEVTNRVDMIEDAVLMQRDAVVVVDHRDQVKFVNQAGKQLTGLEVGWQQHVRLKTVAECLPKEVTSVLGSCRASGKPIASYVKTGEQNLRALYVSQLEDWRKCTIGHVIQIQDLRGLTWLLEAIKRLSACRNVESLGKELLAAVQSAGHGWARFYVVGESSGRLIGKAQFGLPAEDVAAKEFEAGTMMLPAKGAKGTAWLCLEEGVAKVLASDPGRGDGVLFITASGLEVHNVDDNLCPASLPPKTRWIDLPLISREDNRPLGKVTLECPADLPLEALDRLKILGEAAGAALAVIVQRNENERLEAARLRGAMLRAVGETCHQLKSRLVSLVTLAERHFGVASGNERPEVLKEWYHRFESVQKVLDHAQSRLGPVRCKWSAVEVRQWLSQTVEQHIEVESTIIGCASLYADMDEILMAEAVDELILNAVKANGKNKPLRMTFELSRSLVDNHVEACRLEVRDSGPGIPKELLGRIFDEFYSEWPNGNERGTGLGLSRVQSIVLAHGGAIKALESSSGAWFRIEWPRTATRHRQER